MVEPIPFFGLFDDEEPASYLREQIQAQQKRIDELQGKVFELQESLTKAQVQVDALSVPGLWEYQNYGWEMLKNEDGTYTMKPIGEISL